MTAFEFTTNVRDGIIEIPEVHRGRINGTVRVIILTPEREPTEEADFIEELLTNPLQIADFSAFTRDEANERTDVKR